MSRLQRWKKLFFVLWNNKESKENVPRMWKQFMKDELKSDEIKSILFNEELEEIVKHKFDELSSKNPNCEDLIRALGEDALFEDDFWYKLVKGIRDREVRPINRSAKVTIIQGGQEKQITMEDLENLFEAEEPDMMTSQICVPDQLIHDDCFDLHLNREAIVQELKESYEENLLQIKENFKRDNPKWKEKEIEKQSLTLAQKEIKNSTKAPSLQCRKEMQTLQNM